MQSLNVLRQLKLFSIFLIAFLALLLNGCGGGGGGDNAPAPTYTIGGTVTGLSGAGLVLRLNGGLDLSVSASATTFTFATALSGGATYTISVLAQPTNPSQTCSVQNGSGAVGASNVMNVSVTCVNAYTLGGAVTGLAGSGLVLRNNDGNDLAISANGAFTFSIPIASAATYAVTVLTQPTSPSQTCTVTNDSGMVGIANVTNVSVSCATSFFTIGGTVSGLSGTGLLLQNNGANNLAINANGAFTFSTPILSGAAYSVAVLTQPTGPSQVCSITSGSGTVGAANITSVNVTCPNTSLTVSNASDVVNGDTSSPAALNANPGPDETISLREAILAANVAAGPHMITFAPTLAGQTITISSKLPVITRSQVTIQGLTSNGQPSVTLSFAGLPANPGDEVLLVQASDVTISSLRITGVQDSHVAIRVRADTVLGVPLVERVSVTDSVFDQSGNAAAAYGVRIGCDGGATNAVIRNVQVLRSAFTHFRGDATTVHMQAAGSNCRIENTLIQENTITDSTFPVELVAFVGTSNLIAGTRIVRNTFTTNAQPISIGTIGQNGGTASSGNTIDDTLVSANVFSGTENPAIAINGGFQNATGNSITATNILNNVISGGQPFGGINIIGGDSGGSGNAVAGVRVVNNTIVRGSSSGVAVVSNQGNGAGNSVSGVVIQNTIISGIGDDFFGEITSVNVSYSLLSNSTFAGVNGNISGNTLFVDPAQSNYHLQAGSPAIDAGSATGAPARDLECRSRTDDPATANSGTGTPAYVDMGAYEFSGGSPDCAAL